MPGPGLPVFLRRCVRAVAKDGKPLSSAFAICVAQGQKSGNLKDGSVKATSKGKRLSKRKSSEKGAGEKAAEYERLLKGERVQENLLDLIDEAFWLLEADEPPTEDADPLDALDGTVTGELYVHLAMTVGEASDETKRAALKLLRRYQDNWMGGYEGTSVWTIKRMRLRLKGGAIEAKCWITVQNYEGMRVLTDLAQCFVTAAAELACSMTPSDVDSFLGNVTPDDVMAEPVTFIASA